MTPGEYLERFDLAKRDRIRSAYHIVDLFLERQADKCSEMPLSVPLFFTYDYQVTEDFQGDEIDAVMRKLKDEGWYVRKHLHVPGSRLRYLKISTTSFGPKNDA